MVMSYSVVLVVAIVIAVAILGWKVLKLMWLRPRKIEKQLRRQGFKGNSYKLPFGDLKRLLAISEDAKSKPISNLSHDIVPRVFPFFHELLITHGEKYFTWLGPFPMVCIKDPELIKEMLSNHNQFQKPKVGNPLADLLISGLLFEDGAKWVKHRKIINPAFYIDKLKHMVPDFHLCCKEMINKWEEIVSKKDGSCELDVWPDLQTLSADVLSRNAFGSSYKEGRRIFELHTELAELFLKVVGSIYIPGSRYMPTKRNKRIKEIAREVKHSIKSIIDKRLKDMEAGKTIKNDLLSILLESNCKEIQQHGNTNFGLSIDEVIEECKVFYFAGQETTASLLVWTMVLLGQNQNWQEQAREEVLHVFGNKEPNYDGLNQLNIISMILNEVLRLYPPGPQFTRMIHEETKVGDITLPAGAFIDLPVLMLHHDRELWGDDANEFKPERFSEGVAKATKGKTSFLPFGGGPRTCIGINFAMMEAKIAVAMILQRLSFTLSPSYSHAPYTVITLKPQHGAHLILQKLGV